MAITQILDTPVKPDDISSFDNPDALQKINRNFDRLFRYLKQLGGGSALKVDFSTALFANALSGKYSGNPEVVSQLTPPIDSAFRWVNQGTATTADYTDSLVLKGGATGNASNLILRVQTAPATPYIATAYISPFLLAKNFQSYGIGFRQSSDGKLHTLDIGTTDNGASEMASSSIKWTNPTTFSATYQSHFLAIVPRWLRVADDGTNRYVLMSPDGVNWVQYHSIGRTDFITADEIGFYIGTQNQSTPNFNPIIRLWHWKVESGFTV